MNRSTLHRTTYICTAKMLSLNPQQIIKISYFLEVFFFAFFIKKYRKKAPFLLCVGEFFFFVKIIYMSRFLFLLISIGIYCCQAAYGQEYVRRTFKDTRVINTHTVETIQARKLDLRIGHRFGDLKGGWQSFYGLDNAQDILIGVDYGLTDNINVGLNRTKGAGPLTRLVNTTLKYRFLRQSDESPISATGLGIWSISTMQKDERNEFVLNNFQQFSHRFIFAGQILISRKFSERFSLQLFPSYVHRNIVGFEQANGIFSVGFATRFQLTKVLGIIVDSTIPIGNDMTNAATGIGLEIDTGGHVFQVNFTNARGAIETDYIPNTQATWGNGEIRLGFTISRVFNL